ncbi:hypothetical protein K493DRAFT_315630 [Basidiobolus meristosporus CBS 931.73]|uniref:Endonuclease n=1 Tax=Basidiobolus meristosporus CBS 931.73 TaxID=1314790 RepID=A0A1Y1Y9C3_9FUNG|nr:hypothetical protein K493DRAFT_315630 [Basidiobolus meristosporus CBS 931.73]|eukprot:ORX94164.1 hypothetical protein K493DRAFT_315630 [Basidiobolus meristosporus CBS 931.73]
MSARSIALFAGGTVVGAIGLAVYNQSQKPKVSPVVTGLPAPVPSAAPVAVPRPQVPVPPQNNIEIGKQIMKFGFPGPISDIKYRKSYVASYNRQLRNPNWVAEHITVESLKRNEREGVDRSKSTFKEDTSLPEMYRAKLADYFRSGYDRGHMMPAADAKNSQEGMDDTFFMTNISPQVGQGFNRDYWAHLENFGRELTKSFSDVYIITGPLYLPHYDEGDRKWYVKYEMIGNPPNVAVPTHFYKVILGVKNQQQYALGAFVLPNAPIPDDTPLEQFVVPVEALEKSSGLTFFEFLDKAKTPQLCDTVACRIIPHAFYQRQKALQKNSPPVIEG